MSRNFHSCMVIAASVATTVFHPPVMAEPLQEIVVHARRVEQPLTSVAAAVAIVDGDKVQIAQPQLGLDESLNSVSGLFFQNRFNFAQDLRISIRGFGSRASFGIRGIRIFVDGIPETLADGQGSVDVIDLGSVQSIEILKGASSSLYGNAAGGVINIESQLGNETPEVEGRLAFGEYGYQKVQIKATGTHGKADYLLSLSDLESEGYRAHSEAENTVLNLRGRYRFDKDTDLTVALSHTDQPLANDPGGITIEQSQSDPRSARDRNVDLGAGENLDQTRLGWNLNTTLQNGGQLQFRNYWSWRNFDGFIPTSNGAIGIDRVFAGAGIKYQHSFEVGNYRHQLVTGADYDRQADDRTRFENLNGMRGDLLLDQQETVESVGLFIQDTVQTGAATFVTAGVRYDQIRFDLDDNFLSNGNASGDRSMNQISPMLGLTHDVSSNWNVYANVAASYESPTTTELAVIDGGLNPEIDPALATSYEAGLRGTRSWLGAEHTLDTALFYIDLKDELIPFEQADGSDLFVNAGKSRRQGLEFSLVSQLSEFFSSALTYTWSDFEFTDFTDDNSNNFDGNTLPGIPEHLVHLQFDYQNPSGFFATLETQYVGDIPLNNANSAEADAYVLAHLRGGINKTLGNWHIQPFFGINNIGNKSYAANTRINAFGSRYFEPGPERNIYAGIQITYRFASE